MVVKAAGAQIGTKCNLTSSGETRYHRLIEAAALKNSWHLGPPDIMSASEGEKGSWKSWHSKGGCINFIIRCISQFQMQIFVDIINGSPLEGLAQASVTNETGKMTPQCAASARGIMD